MAPKKVDRRGSTVETGSRPDSTSANEFRPTSREVFKLSKFDVCILIHMVPQDLLSKLKSKKHAAAVLLDMQQVLQVGASRKPCVRLD